uniref:Ribosomal protein S5 n=1 Tax=Cyanistes caeruleus TaxID=156563 RepID=A0A8C0ZAL7_CYACU
MGIQRGKTRDSNVAFIPLLLFFSPRMTDWETAPAVTETPDIKLFGKWSTDDVQINDISLQDYIAVKEKYAKYLPHSAGRYAAKRFRKAQCPIVERLTNSMMMHGRNNGKKLMTVRIVKHAFEIIHLLTGEVRTGGKRGEMGGNGEKMGGNGEKMGKKWGFWGKNGNFGGENGEEMGILGEKWGKM